MPYTSLKVKGGFYTENTRAGSMGRWVDGDHVRFSADIPTKIGGWQKLTTQKFLGVCRQLKAWTVLSGEKFIAIATNLKVNIYNDGTLYDITPNRASSILANPFTTVQNSSTVTVNYPNHNLTTLDQVIIGGADIVGGLQIRGTYNVAQIIDDNNFTINTASNAIVSALGGGDFVEFSLLYHMTNPFSTTLGSSSIIVNQPNHGCFPGDFVTFNSMTIVGGVPIDGEYQIIDVLDSNTYVFDAGIAANASVNGGGNVNYLYDINTGTDSNQEIEGFGTKAWGVGNFGSVRQIFAEGPDIYRSWGGRGYSINPWSGGVNYIPVGYAPRLWSMDLFNSDLILNPRGGSLYYWRAKLVDGLSANSSALIPTAPDKCNIVATWPESDILIAFGCTRSDGIFDPMHIRWSDTDSYDNWTPGNGSNSGFVNLSDGNEIVAVCKMRGQILIATDTAVYTMFEDGSTDVFGFKSVGNARVVSQNAIVEVNGIAFYMGEDQFYIYDGNLSVLPSDVQRKVFNELNYDQVFKVYGSINASFNEVWWFYPSKKINADGNINTENDSYVVYNYEKNIWYFGTMNRTAFSDIGVAVPKPIGTSPDGYIYTHEFGVDADGEALPVFLQSGDMMISDRNKFVYIKNIIPDMLEQNTTMNLTLTARSYPSSVKSEITYSFDPTTDVIGTRQKGGQVNFSYYCDEVGSTFAAGDLELLIIPTSAR